MLVSTHVYANVFAKFWIIYVYLNMCMCIVCSVHVYKDHMRTCSGHLGIANSHLRFIMET
jgi:hypothetical protein